MVGLLIPLSLTAARLAAHVKDEEAASGNKTMPPPPPQPFKAGEKKSGSGGEMGEEDCCGTGRPRGRTEAELREREQPTASFLTTNARASAYGRLRERSAPYQLPTYKLTSHQKPDDESGDSVDYATAV